MNRINYKNIDFEYLIKNKNLNQIIEKINIFQNKNIHKQSEYDPLFLAIIFSKRDIYKQIFDNFFEKLKPNKRIENRYTQQYALAKAPQFEEYVFKKLETLECDLRELCDTSDRTNVIDECVLNCNVPFLIQIMNWCRETDTRLYSKQYQNDKWTEKQMIDILKVQSAFNRHFQNKYMRIISQIFFKKDLYCIDFRISNYKDYKTLKYEIFKTKYHMHNFKKTIKCINYEILNECWQGNDCFCYHQDVEKKSVPDEICRFIYKDQCDRKCFSMCPQNHKFKDTDTETYNLQPSKQSKRNVKRKNQRKVKGQKMKLNSIGFVYKLDNYLMPNQLQNLLDDNEQLNTNELNKTLYNTNQVKLTMRNIQNSKTTTRINDNLKRAYHNLLWLEELQTIVDIRQYDTLKQITKNESGKDIFRELQEIKLEKLAEKRPSVLVGDRIQAWQEQLKHVNEDIIFEGQVWFINIDSILVHFGKERMDVSRPLKISFSVNRTSFKLKHRSIDLMYKFQSKLLENPIDYSAESQRDRQPTNKLRQLESRDRPSPIHQQVELQNIDEFVSVVKNSSEWLVMNPCEFFPMIFNKKANNQPYIVFKKEEQSSILSIQIDVSSCKQPVHQVEIYTFDKEDDLQTINAQDLNRDSRMQLCKIVLNKVDHIDYRFHNEIINNQIIVKLVNAFDIQTNDEDNPETHIIENKFEINQIHFSGYLSLNKKDGFSIKKDDSSSEEDSDLEMGKDQLINNNSAKTESNSNKNFKTLNVRQANFISKCTNSQTTTIKILFGPPGTGKTQTLIELTKQLIHANPKAKILLSAPSNQAADLLCYRLDEFFSTNTGIKMVRLNGMLRGPKDLNFQSNIQKQCLMTEKPKSFQIPSIDVLREQNVIIATCTCSGQLQSLGLNENNADQVFDQILIDESGECDIAESIIPVTLASKKTKVILCGDWKQLGPIVRSKICLKLEFDQSLLEKMNQNYSELSETFKLSLSQRSHIKIMHLFNTLFYNGKLKSMRDEIQADAFYNARRDLFPGEAPIRFIHTEGQEQREKDSPSWQNNQELERVFAIIKSLVDNSFKNSRVEYCDIGIVTPYRKQVDKLRSKIHELAKNDKNAKDLVAGTVEQFQGHEKKVIIITTVRSREEDQLQNDLQFKLGFVQNQKRLNVAISRAMDALFIVGNAKYLARQDANWYKMLKILFESGQKGCVQGLEEEDIKFDERQYDKFKEVNEDNELNYDLEFETDKY